MEPGSGKRLNPPRESCNVLGFLPGLRVLGVSVVEYGEETAHHGDTEDTERQRQMRIGQPQKHSQSPRPAPNTIPASLIHMCGRTQTNALPLVYIDCHGN